jgi:hypothetical protein
MPGLSSWLALAAVGALHGLSPASGWMLAAACGVHSRDGRGALRALLPIALGHSASLMLVAGAVVLGLSLDRATVLALAALLLVIVMLAWRARMAGAGMVLWTFVMTGAQGAGLVLVPGLAAVCLWDAPAAGMTTSNAVGLALAAIGVHTLGMLAVTGLLALAAQRGIAFASRAFPGFPAQS